MTTSTIEIPSNFAPGILANATAFFAELDGYTTTIIGILLGILVVEILISSFRK